jgi:hypothetical protein
VGGDFRIEVDGFEVPDAALTPTGHDERLDEGKFDVILRVKALEDAGVEFVETLAAFSGEEEVFRKDAVTDGVFGGAEFAFRRVRASGFGAVTGGGGALPRGARCGGGWSLWVLHSDFIVRVAGGDSGWRGGEVVERVEKTIGKFL